MTREQFRKACAKAQLRGRQLQDALRMHLVDGDSVEHAAAVKSLSRETFDRGLSRLMMAFRSMDWSRPDARRKAGG
jgi:hypothetical protein